jgi:hypothetical protein
MTNQMKPAIEHTRVASAAAMRARDVSRDREAEARGLRRADNDVPSLDGEGPGDPSSLDRPQPVADRPDS